MSLYSLERTLAKWSMTSGNNGNSEKSENNLGEMVEEVGDFWFAEERTWGHKQCLQIFKKLSHRKEIILMYIILKGRAANCFYKFLTMTYKALHDWLISISFILLPTTNPPSCSLQSNNIGVLTVPCTRHSSTSGPFYFLFPLPPWDTVSQNICISTNTTI